ncbi:MAG: beta-ketoacyl-ACP synthase III [Bacillota bacterium]|jgi:3-oxoacyl-[acyl-carrier-protein] synthase-3
MAARCVGIAALGAYVPPHILTNADLEKMVDTSDEWIVERTGIRERRIASEGTATSDLAIEAGKVCLQNARVKPEEVDLIIVASASPDYMFPATACIVQHALGASKAAAFDIEIGCTGFIYAMVTGAQFISSGVYDKVLVIGAETLSRLVNWRDRNTCCLFGDGAGAALLTPAHGGAGILGFDLGVDGKSSSLLSLPAGGARNPASDKTVREMMHYIHMDGRAVFKFAVKIMGESIAELLKKCGKETDEIDLLVPHQANIRIIESACARFRISMEKVMVNIANYGNTSSASVPLALWEAKGSGRAKEGDLVVLTAFGAGLSWGSVAVIL